MVRHTVLGFKLERTEETLTAHGGLALLAECNHGLGVCGLLDRYLPGPGSNRGYAPSVFVDRPILMLQAGGQCLEDLREWTREAGRLRLLGRAVIPDPDTLGDWLRRRGDPQTGQAGLVGLGQVRDELTARLLRRDGHTTYTLDADATLVGGGSATPSGATQGYVATCRCSAFCGRRPCAWLTNFARAMCRRGPGSWSSTGRVCVSCGGEPLADGGEDGACGARRAPSARPGREFQQRTHARVGAGAVAVRRVGGECGLFQDRGVGVQPLRGF